MKALALALFAAAVWAQDGPCTLSGSVVMEKTGEGVERARVLFRRAGTPVVLGYFSGEGGRFKAFGLDAAGYDVSVSRAGLLMAAARRVDLARTCKVEALQLAMTPAAVIAGRVTSAQGGAVENGRVEALRRAWMGRRWQYRVVGSAMTNAAGEYRIGRLAAGRYVLRAHPNGAMMMARRDGVREFTTATYWPGVYEAARAQAVVVETGAELAGHDIGLVMTPMVEVRGRVVSGEGLRAPQMASVMLRPASRGFGVEQGARYQREDGTFVFDAVAPGEYELTAYSAETANIGSAFRTLTVGTQNVDGVEMALEPPFAVKGSVGGKVEAETVWAALAPMEERGLDEGSVWVGADGAFEFAAVQRARYRVSVASKRSGVYLKEIWVGGKRVDGTVADFSAGERTLALVLGWDGGTLEGTTAGAGLVALVPVDLRKLAGRALRVEKAGADGRYSIPGVEPGEYLVYGFEGGSEKMLEDPEWVPVYKGRPVTVTVRAGEVARAEVEAGPLP